MLSTKKATNMQVYEDSMCLIIHACKLNIVINFDGKIYETI